MQQKEHTVIRIA